MISKRNWRLSDAKLKPDENRANLTTRTTLTFQRAETEKTSARQFRKKITTRHFSRRRRPGKNLFVFCRREPFKPLSLCSNYSKWRLLRKSSDGRTVWESFRKHSLSLSLSHSSRCVPGIVPVYSLAFSTTFSVWFFCDKNRSVKKLFNWIRARREAPVLSRYRIICELNLRRIICKFNLTTRRRVGEGMLNAISRCSGNLCKLNINKWWVVYC